MLTHANSNFVCLQDVDETKDILAARAPPGTYLSADGLAHVLTLLLSLAAGGAGDAVTVGGRKTEGGQVLAARTWSLSVDALLQHIAALRAKMGLEDLLSSSIEKLLRDVDGKVRSEQLRQAYEASIKLFRALCPFNTFESLRLVGLTQQAATKIAGQDVIMMLGLTGAGKTTTIHVLDGGPPRRQLHSVCASQPESGDESVQGERQNRI